MITKFFLFLSVIVLTGCASNRDVHRTPAEEAQGPETHRQFINDWR